MADTLSFAEFSGLNVGYGSSSTSFSASNTMASGTAKFSQTYPAPSVILNGDSTSGYTLYVRDADGSLTLRDTLTIPGSTNFRYIEDSPNQLYLESLANGRSYLFSNTPINTATTYSFTGTMGDFVYNQATAVCFTTGTLIRTRRGEIPVENLRIGDIAITASGHERRVTWIGHQDLDCTRHARAHDVHPVRIRAGAFGGGLPERDLYLSPGHPVLVGEGADEVLVPIMCLINGTSIARVPVDTVTYWHVELDQHDILLAEGLPAESFLDYGNRGWFENGADHALTNPDFIPPGLNGRCRPVAVDGPLVEAERRRLDTLFHASLTAHCAWPTRDSWLAA